MLFFPLSGAGIPPTRLKREYSLKKAMSGPIGGKEAVLLQPGSLALTANRKLLCNPWPSSSGSNTESPAENFCRCMFSVSRILETGPIRTLWRGKQGGATDKVASLAVTVNRKLLCYPDLTTKARTPRVQLGILVDPHGKVPVSVVFSRTNQPALSGEEGGVTVWFAC